MNRNYTNQSVYNEGKYDPFSHLVAKIIIKLYLSTGVLNALLKF